MKRDAETPFGTKLAIDAAPAGFDQVDVGALDGRSGEAAFVYCCGIERWPTTDREARLAVIYDLMQPGAVLRIVTPDLDSVIFEYVLGGEAASGAMTRAEKINAWRSADKGGFYYNEEDLRRALDRSGFVDVWRLPPGASSIDVFAETEDSASTVLILEARKPREA